MKQSKVTKRREGLSGDWQESEMWEVKGGKAKCGPNRARRYKDCGQWAFHWRMPWAKGHQSFKGGLSNYLGRGPTGRYSIPQLLALEIKLHHFEIRFQSVQSLEPQIKRSPT